MYNELIVAFSRMYRRINVWNIFAIECSFILLGIILSGNEISQILLSLVLTYFGGSRNRPKWIAWGVVLSALSCFMLAWPHFIYGAGEEALQYTQEYTSKYQVNSWDPFHFELLRNFPIFPSQNVPSVFESRPINTKNNKLCVSTSRKSNVCEDDEVFSYVPLILIFMSQFVLGIASTLYYSLGQSYLDDYTKQRKTPLMLAYAFSMRLFGPTIGYGLAYLVMNIYIDPRFTPTISRDVSLFSIRIVFPSQWRKNTLEKMHFPSIFIEILPGSSLVGSVLAWMEYSWRNNVFICWIDWFVPEALAKADEEDCWIWNGRWKMYSKCWNRSEARKYGGRCSIG